MEFTLTDAEKITLLKQARKSLKSYFIKASPPMEEGTSALNEKCGAFVTLHTETGALRGCIGFIEGRKPLISTVAELARSSAFHDPRFPPLQEKELDRIVIEISVLSPLRRIQSIDEIITGKHGILLRLGYHSGLLLPQVATEQNWDKLTFLQHTCYKAGLEGNAWKNPAAEIDIFTALVFNEIEIIK